ncbi:hypothetical protein ACNAUY_13605 [Acinetobacter tibetensis]|jgi:hypothetical protein|uniref:hypothetical protein n=1 Tax=Acinetobacter tibetensis TaxID=2943497 RepID=UPI003A4E10CE
MNHILLGSIAAIMDSESNGSGKGIPITLTVNGLLISGEITTKADFFNAPENAGLKAMKDQMIGVAKANGLDEGGMEADIASHLYLKNAAYFSAGKQIPATEKTCIMVSLDSVDAFNMGMLSP